MGKLKIALIGAALCLSHAPVFGSPAIDYGVFYSHELLQTDASTVIDYNTGDIPGNTLPGPYSFGAFDHLTPNGGGNSSSVKLPNTTTYPMVFTTDDNSWNYHSTGYASQSAVETAFANGNYSVAGAGPGSGSPSGPLNLTSGSYPNTPQLLLVNGAAAQWLGGSLLLNPGQANTLEWSAFANYINPIGANISFNIYGNSGSVANQNAFTGPFGSGDSAFNTFTLNPGDLTLGDSYVVSISYVQFTDLTTASGGIDVAGNETEINFTVSTVPETNNFWLAGLALIAIGIRFFVRRKTGVATMA